MTNLDRVLISGDITLPTKVHVVKAMGFLVVMYSVSISPYRRLSTTELMLLDGGARKDSRVPWTTRSNQSILKEISPEYSLEGLLLKLKLQHFCHLMQRAD